MNANAKKFYDVFRGPFYQAWPITLTADQVFRSVPAPPWEDLDPVIQNAISRALDSLEEKPSPH